MEIHRTEILNTDKYFMSVEYRSNISFEISYIYCFLCVHVYLCMCVHVCACMVCVCLCMCVSMHVCACACVCLCTCVQVHIPSSMCGGQSIFWELVLSFHHRPRDGSQGIRLSKRHLLNQSWKQHFQLQKSNLKNIKHIHCICRRSVNSGAREMAQWLRALPALPKVLSSIPSNHMVAHNHL